MFSSSELKRCRATVFLSRTPNGLSGFPSTTTELSSVAPAAEAGGLTGACDAVLCGLAVVLPAFLALPGLNTNSTLAELAGSVSTCGSFLAVATTSTPPAPAMVDDEEETQAVGEDVGATLSSASSIESDLCQAELMVKRTLL